MSLLKREAARWLKAWICALHSQINYGEVFVVLKPW